MAARDGTVDDGPEAAPTSSAVVPLLLAGLIAVRLVSAQHAPSPIDAALGLGFTGLALLLLYRERPVFQMAPLPTLCFVGAALVTATVSSRHPLISLLSLTVPMGAVVAFVVVAGAGAAGIRSGLVGLLTGASASSLVAVVQRFRIWPDALQRQEELGLDGTVLAVISRGRPLGLSLSPDLMGGLALAGITAGLALCTVKRRPLRVLLLLLVVLNGVALVVSRSAGCALGLGIACASWLILVAVRDMKSPWSTMTVLLAVGLPGASVLWLGRGLSQLSVSAHERILNWQVGLDVAAQHPLLGVGLARFADAYLAGRVPEANTTRYAHSALVQLVVEAGFPLGLALSSLLVVGPLVFFGRRFFAPPDPTRDVVAAGLLALLARACFDYDLQIASNATAFAVLLAVAWIGSQRPGAVLDPAVTPVRSRRRAWSAGFLLGVATLTGLVGVSFGYHRADVLSAFAPYGVKPEDARPRLRRYLEWVTADPHAAELEAALLRQDLRTCRVACEAVLARAQTFAARTDLPDAPQRLLLHASLLRHGGRHEEARAQLGRVFPQDPGHHEAHRLRVRWAGEDGDQSLDLYVAEARRWGLQLAP